MTEEYEGEITYRSEKIDVVIHYDIDMGYPPQTAGPPDAWDPGAPTICEIESVTVNGDYPALCLKMAASSVMQWS